MEILQHLCYIRKDEMKFLMINYRSIFIDIIIISLHYIIFDRV